MYMWEEEKQLCLCMSRYICMNTTHTNTFMHTNRNRKKKQWRIAKKEKRNEKEYRSICFQSYRGQPRRALRGQHRSTIFVTRSGIGSVRPMLAFYDISDDQLRVYFMTSKFKNSSYIRRELEWSGSGLSLARPSFGLYGDLSFYLLNTRTTVKIVWYFLYQNRKGRRNNNFKKFKKREFLMRCLLSIYKAIELNLSVSVHLNIVDYCALIPVIIVREIIIDN